MKKKGNCLRIPEYLDEFITIKEANYNGDIRREIEECFTLWLEEKYGFNFTPKEHEQITENALNSL